MTQKDEQQMILFMNACRSIFMPFDIVDVHRLMGCVVDSYNRAKEGLNMFISRMNMDDSVIKPFDSFYTNTVNTYNTVLTDKRNLLRKLNDLQMKMSPDPLLIEKSKEIEDILNETDIEG